MLATPERAVTLDRNDILAAAAALAPGIATRSLEIARNRKLPDDLVGQLREAGIFRIAFPEAWGGPEMNPRGQTELVEILAAADTSVGWCAMIGSDSGFLAARLDDEAARELYPHIDTVTAGLFRPSIKATRVDGGYRFSGRFPFGSGSTHADVIGVGAFIDDPAKPMPPGAGPEWRVMLAPASAFEILDTWDTMGLEGSGSNDFACKDLFVPDRHTFSMFDPAKRPEALYRFLGSFTGNLAGVPLGLARRAIDTMATIAGEKVDRAATVAKGQPVLLKETTRVRTAIARAEMWLGAVRAHVYATLDNLWEDIQAERPVAQKTRIDLGLSRIYACRMSFDVAKLMLDTAATSAIYNSSALGRLFRDATVINQHVVVQDSTLEQYGGMLLGEDAPFPWL